MSYSLMDNYDYEEESDSKTGWSKLPLWAKILIIALIVIIIIVIIVKINCQ